LLSCSLTLSLSRSLALCVNDYGFAKMRVR
jgi:hypothetical protein